MMVWSLWGFSSNNIFHFTTFFRLKDFSSLFKSWGKPLLRLRTSAHVVCICMWRGERLSTHAGLRPRTGRWHVHCWGNTPGGCRRWLFVSWLTCGEINTMTHVTSIQQKYSFRCRSYLERYLLKGEEREKFSALMDERLVVEWIEATYVTVSSTRNDRIAWGSLHQIQAMSWVVAVYVKMNTWCSGLT